MQKIQYNRDNSMHNIKPNIRVKNDACTSEFAT